MERSKSRCGETKSVAIVQVRKVGDLNGGYRMQRRDMYERFSENGHKIYQLNEGSEGEVSVKNDS